MLAILAAWLFPKVGSAEGPLHASIVNMVLIGVVFFSIGLSMDTYQLKRSIMTLKSHLTLQFTIFVVTPFVLYVALSPHVLPMSHESYLVGLLP